VTRGELFLVKKPASNDPKRQRVYVVVSRQPLTASRFSTVTCAPVYSKHNGLSTQVVVGPDEGLKAESSIHCDELVSLQKSLLTHYVGRLGNNRMTELNRSLLIAQELE
jgi:mRNA interferase MazF